MWVRIQASKFKSIIVGPVHKHPDTNPDCIAYLERMLQTNSNCGKNMCMLVDLNEDLLKVNWVKQILNKLNLYQRIKEPTRITPRSKTLIDVIITNDKDTVMHAEISLSIAEHHAVSCTINLRKQRMTPFPIYGRNCANSSPEFFQIKLMQLPNQLNQMYETDSVDTQVQFLTDNFWLALDSYAQFGVKLIKRQPARWMTETIKNEINKNFILGHEYKSIVEDTAKLQKETEYKPKKLSFVSWLKNKKCSIIVKHSIMLEKILKRPGTY